MANRRMTRKFKELNEQNLNELIRETYTDIVDERNKAVTMYNKYYNEIYSESSTDMDDEMLDSVSRRNTIALIGKHLTDSLKMVDNAIDNKIKLIRIYSTHILKSSGNKDAVTELETIGKMSTTDRQSIHELLNNANNDLEGLGEKTYD